jgi:hypothetical protein
MRSHEFRAAREGIPINESMDMIYNEKQNDKRKTSWRNQARAWVAQYRDQQCETYVLSQQIEWRLELVLQQEGAGTGPPCEMEQCDAIRLKYLPTHVQEDAAKNYSMLYKAIAFRAKKLAPEDIATFAFRKANSALRDLQLKETADEEALIKFQQANSVLKLAEELLQQTQLKTTTELNKDQHEGFQHQLKTAEGQLRDLHSATSGN